MAGDDCTPGTFEPDDRPWLLPGNVRRDVEPHRGGFLVVAAQFALALSLSGYCLVVPAAIALPLCAYIGWIAKADLRKMANKQMDPDGMAQTQRAADYAALGALFTIGPAILFMCLFIMITGARI